MDPSGFSIERLIRQAFRYRLITDYRMTPQVVQLYYPDTLHEFDHEEARFFLRGLICGYLRAHELGVPARPHPTASHAYFTSNAAKRERSYASK